MGVLELLLVVPVTLLWLHTGYQCVRARRRGPELAVAYVDSRRSRAA